MHVLHRLLTRDAHCTLTAAQRQSVASGIDLETRSRRSPPPLLNRSQPVRLDANSPITLVQDHFWRAMSFAPTTTPDWRCPASNSLLAACPRCQRQPADPSIAWRIADEAQPLSDGQGWLK